MPDASDTLQSEIDQAKPFVFPAPRIRLLAFDDIQAGAEPAYLLKGLIPRVGLTVIWGAPKSGKSFWCFDAMMHVALDRDYRGRHVQAGPVVYIAAEGANGLKNRIAAFRQERMYVHEGTTPFYLVPVNLDLVHEHPDLIHAIEGTIAAPAAVVIDTLNRTLRGSESSDADMSAYVAAADAIRERFNCAVIVVHHCGYDDKRMRGHSGLPGALDAEISIKRDGGDNIIATVERMKDGPEGETETSRLVSVTIGTDADGDPITSCVVEPTERTAPTDTGPKLTKNQTTMFSILHDAGQGGLTTEDWNAQARKAGIGTGRKADLYDTRRALKAKKLVYESNGKWFAQR